jgi:hypothetical protein
LRKVCFIHYYGTPFAAEIFAEIADAICSSGLLEALSELHLNLTGDLVLGPRVEDLNRLSSKISVHVGSEDTANSGELATLELLQKQARNQHEIVAICYLHTKGATNNSHIQQAWRTYMLDFIAFCWRNAEHKLHSYHLWGVNWSYSGFDFDEEFDQDVLHRPFGHFMGNFWWARSDYISNLPDLNRKIQSRYFAEAWVGMRSGRVFNAMRSPAACPDAEFLRESYIATRNKLLRPTTTLEVGLDLVREFGADSLGRQESSCDLYRHDPSWDHIVGQP